MEATKKETGETKKRKQPNDPLGSSGVREAPMHQGMDRGKAR